MALRIFFDWSTVSRVIDSSATKTKRKRTIMNKKAHREKGMR